MRNLISIPFLFVAGSASSQWWLNDFSSICGDSTVVYQSIFRSATSGLVTAPCDWQGNGLYYKLLATDDGCSSWQELLVADNPIRFHQVNDTVILLQTYNITGGLLRSTDAGATWNSVGSGGLRTFSFPQQTLGIGHYYFPPTFAGPPPPNYLMRTTDLGASWEILANLNPLTVRSLNAMAFNLGQIGLITYGTRYWDGFIARSADQGVSWNITPAPLDSAAFGKCMFLTDSIAFVVGTHMSAGSQGFILRSVDSGSSWTLVATSDSTFTDIAFADASIGYATTTKGSIYRTNDAGLTWGLDFELAQPRKLLTLSITGNVGRAFGELRHFVQNDWLAEIDESIAKPVMRIGPNPCSDMATAWMEAPGEVLLMDASGRVVERLDLRRGENQLPVQVLSDGVYVLRAATGESMKLVKAALR